MKRNIQKHINIYVQLMIFNLKFLTEYRINSFVRFFYGPAYVIVMLLILQVVFGQTQTLGGWSHEEGLTLFYVYQFMYSTFVFTFMEGLRDFMWHGVREGKVDMILTKPLNTQFFISFSKPNLDTIFMLLGLTVLFARQMFLISDQLQLLNVILFIFSFVIGWLIGYFVLTTFATLALFVTRAEQIIELVDKFSDYSQYPTSIFPHIVQVISFTVIPIAFFSYVPTSILLGKSPLWFIPVMILVLIVSIIINQFAWREGLKRYSSASS